MSPERHLSHGDIIVYTLAEIEPLEIVLMRRRHPNVRDQEREGGDRRIDVLDGPLMPCHVRDFIRAAADALTRRRRSVQLQSDSSCPLQPQRQLLRAKEEVQDPAISRRRLARPMDQQWAHGENSADRNQAHTQISAGHGVRDG